MRGICRLNQFIISCIYVSKLTLLPVTQVLSYALLSSVSNIDSTRSVPIIGSADILANDMALFTNIAIGTKDYYHNVNTAAIVLNKHIIHWFSTSSMWLFSGSGILFTV